MNCYRVSICFSYDIETDKDFTEAESEAAETMNRLTGHLLLKTQRIELKKIKQPKHRIKLAEFSVDDVLPYVSRETKKRQYDVGKHVYDVRMDSSRYFVFRENLYCSACGLEGVKFCLELSPGDKNPHFNLYGIEDGRFILMTKDHIKPKSKGGLNLIENYQTYCCICNNLKGNSGLSNEKIRELRIIYNKNKNLPKKKLSKLLNLNKTIMNNNEL